MYLEHLGTALSIFDFVYLLGSLTKQNFYFVMSLLKSYSAPNYNSEAILPNVASSSPKLGPQRFWGSTR